MSSSLSPDAASSLDQKLEERSHEVHRKLGPTGQSVLQEHIANTKSYPTSSSTDAMEHNPQSNPPSRPAFPLRTILPLPPSLLDSSNMLSPGEEQTIQDTIHDISTTLTSIDDEITRVRATLSALEEYRSTLQTTLARHRGALSPIRKLPPEILGEIFMLVCLDDTLEYPGFLDDCMPWLLSEICRYWRMVAISIPKLWSNIHLALLYGSIGKGLQNFLNLCLSRSKNELLTFSLYTENLAQDLSSLLPILDILVGHSERWQNISLNTDQLPDLRDSLPPAKNRVPKLRRLHIESRQLEFEELSSSPFDAFEYAENLREVSFTNIDSPLHNIRVPWSQITHLTTNGCIFSDGEFTQAMRHMTNLIAFSTDRDEIWDEKSTQASTPPALLPHLRTLSITNESSEISATCCCLTVPALEELSISAVTTMLMEGQIVAMIERSGCRPKHLKLRSSLETLETDETRTENLAAVRVLSALPSLAHLELTVARADLHVLDALTNYGPSTEGAPLFPNLQSLVLEDRFCTAVFEIANALSKRVANDVRPGSLSICLRLLPPAVLKPYVQDLLQGLPGNHGIEITILSD